MKDLKNMSANSYKTILKRGIDEFEVDRSRFIGSAQFAETQEEAENFIKEISEKYKDATHNVYAYIIDNTVMKYSDDGEPSGTAGPPILSILQNKKLKKTVVVVTRYFGGRLLGKGGLVRAYSKATLLALDKALIIDKTLYFDVQLIVSYLDLGRIKNYLSIENIHILKEDFTDKVCIQIYIHTQGREKLIKDLNDLTNGNIDIKINKELFLPELDGKIIL